MESARDAIPNFALRMLRWFCPQHLLEEIEGDLMERFHRDLRRTAGETERVIIRRARRRFYWNVIRYFRPGILFRNQFFFPLNDLLMFSNYMKTAFRVMYRNAGFSALNLAGLTIGIASALLLFVWVHYEFSFDQFHANKGRLYMAWNRMNVEGDMVCSRSTPRPLASAIAENFAGVETALSFAQYADTYVLKTDSERVQVDRVTFTDADFFTVFSFPLVRGNAEAVLKEPASIVLTETFAHRLFGEREALGQVVTIPMSGMEFSFAVTGVAKDLPGNTDFDFDFLIPFQFLERLGFGDENWNNHSLSTFVLLKDGVNLETLNHELADIRKQYAGDADDVEVFLYPYTRNHLYSRFENGVPAGGRIEVVRMLTILGFFLIGIASINFVNLSTARAQRRAREVGIRKVTGAVRTSLVFQFLSESVLFAWFAALLATVIVFVALPAFNTFSGLSLSVTWRDYQFWFVLAAGATAVGILAGAYPSFFLSSFKPIGVLKGESVLGRRAKFFRNGLVFLQFGFVVTLVVSSLVVRNQIVYVQERETGYEREHLLYHPITGDLRQNYAAYRSALLEAGVAVSVTKTSSPITERMSSTTDLSWEGKDPGFKAYVERFHIDERISHTAGLTVIQGRDLDLEKYPSDSTAVLLNEAAVRLMDFEHPIGQTLYDYGHAWTVVGVVRDFVLTSPMQAIEPIVLMGAKHDWVFSNVHIRINPSLHVSEVLRELDRVHTRFNSEYPLEVHFVDAEYDRKFSGMERTLALTTLFTLFALSIACLGLLGLSTYVIESRTREIGIRRVLGGSVGSIVRLLNKGALKPIVVAIIVFSPMAWFSMKWWLSFFAYRTPIHAWVFLVSGAAILLIAIGTISIQVLRAAVINPVDTLRTE